jgi:chromosome segregation ATPase
MSFVSEITDAIKLFVEPQLAGLRQATERLQTDVAGLLSDQKESQKQLASLSERLARLEARFDQAEKIVLAKAQAGEPRHIE